MARRICERTSRASSRSSGHGAPLRRARRPVAGPARVVGRQEAIGIDRRALALVVAAQRGERHGARLALAAGLGAVGQDAKEPRLQRGAALEALEAREHGAPGLLDDLLRHRRGAHVAERDALHQAAVAAHEGDVGALVAQAQGLQELFVLCMGRIDELHCDLWHAATLRRAGVSGHHPRRCSPG